MPSSAGWAPVPADLLQLSRPPCVDTLHDARVSDDDQSDRLARVAPTHTSTRDKILKI